MNRRQLQLYGLVPPCFCLTFVCLMLFGPWSARLPDPLATQWGFGAHSKSCMPLNLFRLRGLALIGGFTFAQLHRYAKLKELAQKHWQGRDVSFAPTLFAIASIIALIVWNNLDSNSCHDSDLSWPSVCFGLATPILVSLRRKPFEEHNVAQKRPTLDLRPGQSAVWIKRIHSLPLFLVGFVISATIALSAPFSSRSSWSIAGLCLLLFSSFSWIRVQIGVNGLAIYYRRCPLFLSRRLRSVKCSSLAVKASAPRKSAIGTTAEA